MTLLVDAGNTRVKWTRPEGDGLEEATWLPWSDNTTDELAAAWSRRDDPGRIVVASVAGTSRAGALTEACRRLWGRSPEFPRARTAGFGVQCAYPEPERLGPDRWAAMIGAHRAVAPHAQSNLCVVDCGTAVTVDVLRPDGMHLGGLIAPGPALMQRALLAGTGELADAHEGPAVPRASDDAPRAGDELLGVDTREAIERGADEMLVGFVHRLPERLARRYGSPPLMILTGGDAQIVRGELPTGSVFEPDLVLLGLAVMAEESA